jgi:cytochrome c553
MIFVLPVCCYFGLLEVEIAQLHGKPMLKQPFTSKYSVQWPLNNNRHPFSSLLILLSALLTFGCTAEADIQAGKVAAVQCQACHGKDGIGITPQTPNLAGQKELYLSNQLVAYRSGTRKNSIMSPLAQPLSDEEIANLAAYFASLPAAGSP